MTQHQRLAHHARQEAAHKLQDPRLTAGQRAFLRDHLVEVYTGAGLQDAHAVIDAAAAPADGGGR